MTSDSPKCSRCGQPAQALLAAFNLGTQATTCLCSRCAADDLAQSIDSFAEIEELIAELSEMVDSLGAMIKAAPEMPSLPGGLTGFAMTPLTVFKSTQTYLAALQTRRMELKQAVETEDYERAAYLP